MDVDGDGWSGMIQNRTNGLGFLLVGCFDLASLHSLYSYVFFLLLFVLCSGIVYYIPRLLFFFIHSDDLSFRRLF